MKHPLSEKDKINLIYARTLKRAAERLRRGGKSPFFGLLSEMALKRDPKALKLVGKLRRWRRERPRILSKDLLRVLKRSKTGRQLIKEIRLYLNRVMTKAWRDKIRDLCQKGDESALKTREKWRASHRKWLAKIKKEAAEGNPHAIRLIEKQRERDREYRRRKYLERTK
ncbi:MAG TPA: hypothetical protein EYP60_01865 [bacterium (Candidatus Stahlbacteria)]|nr:hypothetical protein [Candidatus Stahlbacteria bacterium]